MKNGTYTNDLIDAYIRYADENSDVGADDMADVFDLVSFRPFSERLFSFCKGRVKGADDPEKAASALSSLAKSEDIPLNRNTLKNWFSGEKAPYHDSKSRRNLYRICFAMKLGTSETANFFRKVSLDRAFNMRDPEEFIYYYCLKNRYTYKKAQKMLADLAERVALEDPGAAEPQALKATEVLISKADKKQKADEIVDFIAGNPEAFCFNMSLRGNEKERQLLDELLGRKGEKDGIALREVKLRAESSGYDLTAESPYKNRDTGSLDFLLYAITGLKRKGPGAGDGADRISRRLPVEVRVSFPSKDNFTDSDPYSVRRRLILLYFYKFWAEYYLYSNERRGREMPAADEKTFEAQADSMLFDCGFPPLYAGNPYDWFFLFCSAAGRDRKTEGLYEDPISAMRDLLRENDDEY